MRNKQPADQKSSRGLAVHLLGQIVLALVHRPSNTAVNERHRNLKEQASDDRWQEARVDLRFRDPSIQDRLSRA